MNWYKKASIKVAKHASDESHTCFYCKDFLKPVGFSKNMRHHFNWGIDYKCACGKSGLWTNSIRGPKEFIDVVYNNVPPENNTSWKGFCNDLFCPFCKKDIQVSINGLYMTDSEQPIAIIKNKEDKWDYYFINNLDKYIVNYNKNHESILSYNHVCMGKKADPNLIVKAIDMSACSSLEHNIGLIMNGYASEYGEGEYKPIYEWIISNKIKIPPEMINGFRRK